MRRRNKEDRGRKKNSRGLMRGSNGMMSSRRERKTEEKRRRITIEWSKRSKRNGKSICFRSWTFIHSYLK